MIRKVIEKCKKKKEETDGGYGDLGVIPSAPSNVGDKKNKEKELMIVDGEIRSEDKK